ncbi:MAG: radical SAM protein [Fibrobacterota bacterium]
MNILLINPPGNEYVRAGSRWPHKRSIDLKMANYNPFPFALAYAAATLKKTGHTVSLIDCPVLRWDIDRLKTHIRDFAPSLIIMETSAPSYPVDITCASQVRPVPVCAAGAFATATVKQHLADGFPYVFKGEYIHYIADFVSAFIAGAPLPGYVAHPGRPEAEHAPLIPDLDILPYPLREQIPLERYHDPFSRGFNIAVMASMGCPFSCMFCTLAPYQGGIRYRPRQPDRVVDEIIALGRTRRFTEIMFDDDTLTVSKPHLIALCREIIARVPQIKWSGMGNVPIDDETADWMRRAGCRAIKLGVESGVQEVLDAIPKRITLQQIRDTFDILKKHRIRRHATLMVGLPGDTPERAKISVNFILGLKPDSVQFSTAIPYPGTRFYTLASEKGWLSSEDPGCYNGAGATPVSYPDFPAAEIYKAYQQGLRKWHRYMLLHKPATVFHHLRNVFLLNITRRFNKQKGP